MASGSKSNRTDRRVLKTRRAIKKAFRALVVNMPLDKITVSAVAHKADIDRKTFYLHYSSIEELTESTVDEAVDKLFENLERIANQKDERRPGNIILALDSTLQELQFPPEKLANAFTIDRLAKSLEDPRRVTLLRAKIGSHNSERFDTDPALKYVVHFMLAGSLSAYVAWIKGGRRESVETVASVVDDIFLFRQNPLRSASPDPA